MARPRKDPNGLPATRDLNLLTVLLFVIAGLETWVISARDLFKFLQPKPLLLTFESWFKYLTLDQGLKEGIDYASQLKASLDDSKQTALITDYYLPIDLALSISYLLLDQAPGAASKIIAYLVTINRTLKYGDKADIRLDYDSLNTAKSEEKDLAHAPISDETRDETSTRGNYAELPQEVSQEREVPPYLPKEVSPEGEGSPNLPPEASPEEEVPHSLPQEALAEGEGSPNLPLEAEAEEEVSPSLPPEAEAKGEAKAEDFSDLEKPEEEEKEEEEDEYYLKELAYGTDVDDEVDNDDIIDFSQGLTDPPREIEELPEEVPVGLFHEDVDENPTVPEETPRKFLKPETKQKNSSPPRRGRPRKTERRGGKAI